MDDEFFMPLEVKIGTCDSMARDTMVTTDASSRQDVTSDSTWDAPPDSEEGILMASIDSILVGTE